jgi:hypothetical protein
VACLQPGKARADEGFEDKAVNEEPMSAVVVEKYGRAGPLGAT